MKKYLTPILTIFLILLATSSHAQHKIVWEMGLSDTAQQATLYRQMNNVLTGAPGTTIEVVFHSGAVYALLKDTGYFKPKILELHKKGVVFAICQNSLKARSIDSARVMPEAKPVPSAIIEIVQKQGEGWSYIKAGN